MMAPKITKLELVVFQDDINNMGTDYNGFNTVFHEGNVMISRPSILKIHTDVGLVGEYVGRVLLNLNGKPQFVVQRLVAHGEDQMERVSQMVER